MGRKSKNKQSLAEKTQPQAEQNLANTPHDDRFSLLPQSVIHHIFSFLGANDIARLYLVSRFLRKSCVSSPYLDFDLKFDKKNCSEKCRQYKTFIDNFFKQKDEELDSLQMYRFRLHWSCHHKDNSKTTSIFNRLIQKATSCKVPEIDIGFDPAAVKCDVLPACILKNPSVRVLNLDLQGSILNHLPKEFPLLQVLSLNSVEVASGRALGAWISTYCGSISTLKLKNVYGIDEISITSSSLKELIITDCIPEGDYENYFIDIICPSLESFALVGNNFITKWGHIWPSPRKCVIMVDCSSLKSIGVSECGFEELRLTVIAPSLVDLRFSKCNINGGFDIRIVVEQLQTLFVDMFLNFFYAPDGTFTIESGNMKSLQHVSLNLGDNLQEKFITESLVQLCETISCAQTLELDFVIIQVFVVENIAAVNLQQLVVIVDQLEDYHITIIASFLDKLDLDSLKTLKIRCKENQIQFTESEFVKSLKMELKDLGRTATNLEITWLEPPVMPPEVVCTCTCTENMSFPCSFQVNSS